MSTARRVVPALILLLAMLVGGALWLVTQVDDERPRDVDVPEERVVRPSGRSARANQPTRPDTGRERVVAGTADAGDHPERAKPTGAIEYVFPPGGAAPLRTVTVTVVREDGGPVRDAVVSAFTGFGHVTVVPERATTDIAGQATLQISGDTQFRVRAWTRDAAGISDRQTVGSGQEAAVTLRLAVARPVSGTLVARDGRAGGIAGADVVLGLGTDDPFGLFLTTTSGPDGEFDFGGVPETLLLDERTRVSAVADGHAEYAARLAEFSDWTALRLELERGQTVTGRCISAAGAPVVGIQVASGTRATTTGGDGRFSLVGVAWTGASLTVHPVNHVLPPPRRLLDAGGEIDIGDIVLEDGRPISGRVVDGNGAPVPGATIDVLRSESGAVAASATTDELGQFRASHIGEGEHVVVASGVAGGWTSKVTTVERGVLAGTSDVELVLSGGLSLLVTFLDEADRSQVTVASAEVRAWRTDTGADPLGQAWAGARIEHVRITLATAGTYSVEVKVPGYGPATVEGILILPDREVRIDALLRKALE